MEKFLHIVSSDVPFPVDYGGVIDVYCTVKALHEAGVKVHLHCFDDGKGKQPELDQYCEVVHYYQRLSGHKCISPKLPYMVASRSCNQLRETLLKDDYPILLEGIQCTYLLNDERFDKRQVFVRLMNVEHEYYEQLCKTTTVLQPLKKIYYHHESRLLKNYEKNIADKAVFLALSEKDVSIYRQKLQAQNVMCLPPMLPFTEVETEAGIGCFCLYHGNLSVEENEEAAIWLLNNIFNKIDVPFIIAGKHPTARLQREVDLHGHACLIANPSAQEMADLIRKAQIHVLPSFCRKSRSVKLMNALFGGRHCVVNPTMVACSGLDTACHVATTAEAFQSIIIQLYHQPFDEHELKLRKEILTPFMNQGQLTKQLMNIIWQKQPESSSGCCGGGCHD
ncbi:glycosyltransferase [Paraflavitalea pollutisoli]|uniref:glycosyltransferase n=1 Tax=Paraflavitalea pollutisoli TaxID=3034143 RepID=UPI0023EE203E|nr:glycosyltransferase [Paraflavitalea sp. H1-2-19X]